MFAFWNIAVVLGINSMLTPPLRAPLHCPSFMLLTRVWSATNEDEHAVSTGIEGPWSPNVYDILPAATLIDKVLVADNGEYPSIFSWTIVLYSVDAIPYKKK